MKPNSIKALSIQISLSGLSFCILNRSTNTIEFLKIIYFEKKVTPFELLNDLKHNIESNTDFEQDFDTVLCIYQNELSCLVPKDLFNENNLADYLKFNAKILKTDFINYDTMPTNSSVNVYVPLVNINNYIFDVFGSFDYKHASTVLIETLLQLTPKDTSVFHVNVNASTFEIIYINDSKLEFYNTFEFITKEDFIYYILFTFEQLKLNPETVKVVLSGLITKESEPYEMLYKYVRHVAFTKPKYSYNFKTTRVENQEHSDFVLLNSFN